MLKKVYRKEEEEEKNGNKEVDRDREDYNTFWNAFTGRVGIGD